MLDQRPCFFDLFEELVQRHGGKAIAVVEGKVVAVADTEKEASQLAREAYSGATALVLSILLEEELVCLL